MSSATDFTITNLELRESNPDGSEGAGLSHSAEGMFLLHVKEMAVDGEPRGCVTVLHDAGDHGGRYLELGARCSSSGWAIALPDLRGHGESEGDRGHSWGAKEVVRDVGDILDHLAYQMPSAPQVLVGQGLGALYAAYYALDQPGRVAALVLSAPLLAPRFHPPETKGGLMKLFKKPAPTDPGKIGYTPQQRTSDPAELAALTKDARVHDVMTRRGAESIQAAATRVRAEFAQLDVPVLVLHGTADPIVTASEIASLNAPKLEHRSFEGRLHDLFHERDSDEVVSVVLEWLGEHV